MSKKTVQGFGLVLLFVACNGLLSWRLGRLSYSHFTWEAFAQYYYGPTAVQSPAPTMSESVIGVLAVILVTLGVLSLWRGLARSRPQ